MIGHWSAKCRLLLAVAALMALGAGGLAAGGAATAQVAGHATARTTVTNVSPLTYPGVLKLGYRVTATLRRTSCSDTSEIVVGADRCFAGNLIMDPCWPYVNQYGYHGGDYCMSSPWLKLGVRLLGSDNDSDRRQGRSLWAVQRANGLRCGMMSGASDLWHGRRLNFGCKDGRYLVGMPDKRFRIWRMTAVLWGPKGPHSPITVRITHGWYGVSPDGL